MPRILSAGVWAPVTLGATFYIVFRDFNIWKVVIDNGLGLTETRVNDGTNILGQFICTTSPTTAVMWFDDFSPNGGWMYSSDSAATFTLKLALNATTYGGYLQMFYRDLSDTNVVWAATVDSSSGEVFWTATLNGGQTWNKYDTAYQGAVDQMVVAPRHDGSTAFVVISHSTGVFPNYHANAIIYKVDSSGNTLATWTFNDYAVGIGIEYGKCAVPYGDHNKMIMSRDDTNQLYTFDAMLGTISANGATLAGYDVNQITPTKNGSVLAVSGNFSGSTGPIIWRTTNLGVNWSSVDIGISGGDTPEFTRIAQNPSSNTLMLVGTPLNSTNRYISTDDGISWIAKTGSYGVSVYDAS